MPVNELVWDNVVEGMLLVFILESCVIMFGFLLFNAIYREKKYFKKSLVALIIMFIYQVSTNEIVKILSRNLHSNYNRNIDFIMSFGIPFLFLGSITTLYLGIKHNKVYLIAYLYNAFFFIQAVLETVNPSLQLFNDAVYPVIYILFLFTYLIPLLLFFMHIKEDWWNSLKRNIS